MKVFNRFSGFVVALSALAVVLSATAKAEDPVVVSPVSSVIKNVGEPKCVAGHEVQDMSLVLTFKDAAGKATEVDFKRWQQATGKTCAATRGPKPAAVTGAILEKEASTQPSKTRSGPCWCYYTYYYINGCIYYRVYDCNWNFCFTTSNC
jgi:hypothetical protein